MENDLILNWSQWLHFSILWYNLWKIQLSEYNYIVMIANENMAGKWKDPENHR